MFEQPGDALSVSLSSWSWSERFLIRSLAGHASLSLAALACNSKGVLQSADRVQSRCRWHQRIIGLGCDSCCKRCALQGAWWPKYGPPQRLQTRSCSILAKAGHWLSPTRAPLELQIKGQYMTVPWTWTPKVDSWVLGTLFKNPFGNWERTVQNPPPPHSSPPPHL